VFLSPAHVNTNWVNGGSCTGDRRCRGTWQWNRCCAYPCTESQSESALCTNLKCTAGHLAVLSSMLPLPSAWSAPRRLVHTLAGPPARLSVIGTPDGLLSPVGYPPRSAAEPSADRDSSAVRHPAFRPPPPLFCNDKIVRPSCHDYAPASVCVVGLQVVATYTPDVTTESNTNHRPSPM
jgi:hypothetical protein